MPIDDVYVDEPFYFSSSGSLKEILVKHTGADALIQNTVGEIQVKNTQVDEDIVININDGGADTEIMRIDAATSTIISGSADDVRFEFSTTDSGVQIYNTGANTTVSMWCFSGTSTDECRIGCARARGTESVPLAVAGGDDTFALNNNVFDGALYRNIGQLKFVVDTYTGSDNVSGYATISTRNDGAGSALTERFRVGKQGDITVPASYSTVIGGTNVDLYIDNTGLLGPAPCSKRYKEEIRVVDDNETGWIMKVPVKSFKFKGGHNVQIGVIAEELEKVNPNAVRYETYIAEGGKLKKIDRGQYKSLLSETDFPVNKLIKGRFMKKTSVPIEDKGDRNIEKTTEDEIEIGIKRVPEGILKDQLFFALVNEVQKLNSRVLELEQK